MSQFFPKPYEPLEGDINVKFDWSNYAIKSDLKNAAEIDSSKWALKSHLANVKAEIYKTDVDKSKTVPIDLSKLRNVVNNDIVTKTVR